MIEDKHEEELGKIIDERDQAEKALSMMFSQVTGSEPEWSNIFGYTEAIEEVANRIHILENSTSRGNSDDEVLNEALSLLPKVMRKSYSDAIIRKLADQENTIKAMKRTSNARMLAFEAAMSDVSPTS